MTGTLKKVLSVLGLAAAWILMWQTAYKLSGKEDFVFPPPLLVLDTIRVGVLDGTFPRAILASLGRIGYGFGLAIVAGTFTGLLLVGSRFFEWLLGPLVLGIQSLPSICWLPVAILWFGLSEKAVLFVVLMGSIGSITIATRDGLRQVPLTYQRVAGTFGANPFQRLMWVSIPAAMPVFISGLKQGWSFAWRSLLAGELLYKLVGAGGLLTEARDLADYPKMFAVMILIVCVSVLVDKVFFSRLEERVRVRWGLMQKTR